MQYALAFAPVLFLVPVLLFLLPVLTRLLKSSQLSELTVEWFENFQVSSYAPMRGLLAREDFQFLSSQPGFDPSLMRKLRQDRLRIFRGYLNRLIVDYNRLYAVATFVISQSPDDQSGLFAKLLSLRVQFGLSVLRVEFSYLLCRLGCRSVSIGGLLHRIEALGEMASLPRAKAWFQASA